MARRRTFGRAFWLIDHGFRSETAMLRVGLTGGLGSGKTTIARLFAELGAQVIAADEIGRRLMQPGQPVYRAIVSRFGEQLVSSDGSLDRAALAELAFQHHQADALNQIVHPAVIAAEEEWTRNVFAQDPAAVAIVESALIFEAAKRGTAPGWLERFDKLILVTVPDEIKIARFVSRGVAARAANGQNGQNDQKELLRTALERGRASPSSGADSRLRKGRTLRLCH